MEEALAFFAETNDGACAIDRNQHIVFWNQAAANLLGYSGAQVIGQPCHQIFQGISPQGKPICHEACPLIDRCLKNQPVGDMLLSLQGQQQRHLFTLSTVAINGTNGVNGVPILIHVFNKSEQPRVVAEGLAISLLGPIEVLRPDGSQVTGPLWQRQKVRALLAFLVQESGKQVPRETLLTVLWPQMKREAALRNLNTTVYGLRRSLEPQLNRGSDSRFIRYHQGCYWLDGYDEHDIDVQHFRHGLQQARQDKNIAKAIGSYRAALSYYRGEYASDVDCSEFWFGTERIRLRRLYLSALEELGRLFEQQGDVNRARDIYIQLLGYDPARERAGQRLVQLSTSHDDWPAALAYCRRLAAALQDELDSIISREIRRQSDKTHE